MPNKPKHEVIQCQFFQWKLTQRAVNGVFYADARFAADDRGRHSLATRDRAEALSNLAQLDRVVA